MTKIQEEIIQVLSSPINVRKVDRIKWRNNPMQESIVVLDAILQLIKENKVYQKPNALLVQQTSKRNNVIMSPYVLMLQLRYEINKGIKEKEGLELLRLLKLQACRKASNASSTIPMINIDTV
jgi:hypothetical protein